MPAAYPRFSFAQPKWILTPVADPGPVTCRFATAAKGANGEVDSFSQQESCAALTAFNSGQDIAPTHPLCGAALPDGERIQVCRPPATRPGTISVTIRRPPSFRPTLQRLADGGLFRAGQSAVMPGLDKFMDDDWVRLLGQAVRSVNSAPPVWVQMSTGHIYGDPPAAVCTENSATGMGYSWSLNDCS